MSSPEPGDGFEPRVISSPPIPSVPSENLPGLDARLASAQSSNLDTTIQPASGTGDSSDHTGEGRGLPSSVPQQHPQQQQQRQPLQPQPGRSTSPAASIRGSDDGWPDEPASGATRRSHGFPSSATHEAGALYTPAFRAAVGRGVSFVFSLAVDELVAHVHRQRPALTSDLSAASVLVALSMDADVALSLMCEWESEAELAACISRADGRDDGTFLRHALARHAARQPPPAIPSGCTTQPSHGDSEGAGPSSTTPRPAAETPFHAAMRYAAKLCD